MPNRPAGVYDPWSRYPYTRPPLTVRPGATDTGQIMTGAPSTWPIAPPQFAPTETPFPSFGQAIAAPAYTPPLPSLAPTFGIPSPASRGPLSPAANQLSSSGPLIPPQPSAMPLTAAGDLTPEHALTGLAQFLAQPLTDQPLVGLGAILSGAAAGLEGRPNPVIAQLLQAREAQTNRVIQLGTLGLSMQQMAMKQSQDNRDFKYKQTKDLADVYQSVGMAGLGSLTPSVRIKSVDLINKATQMLGGEIPPALAQAMSEGTVTQAKNQQALGLLLSGMPASAVAAYLDTPLPVIESLFQLAQNPQSFLGVKALTGVDPQDILKAGKDMQLLDLKIIAEAMGLEVGDLPKEANLLVWDPKINPKQLPPHRMDPQYRASVLGAVRTAYAELQVTKGQSTVAQQPVPFDAAKGQEMLAESATLAKGLYGLVVKHEDELTKYTGIRGGFGVRETFQKQFGGGISDPVKVIFGAFDTIRNNMSTYQKGAALGPGEYAMFVKVYTDVTKWGASVQDMKFAAFYAGLVLPVIERRMSLLLAPGGRGQLILKEQGPQAYQQFENEVRAANPLPTVVDMLERYRAAQPSDRPSYFKRTP
mgnify:CR=1 FL=1